MDVNSEKRAKFVAAQSRKVKKIEMFEYGFGGFGSTIIAFSVSTFILFFFTNVAGIPPSIAGLIIMVATLFDAINDPIIGAISDKINTKWGRYRPLLMFCTPIAVIVAASLFAVPNLTGNAKIAYYLIMYLLYSVSLTSMMVPYQSLTAVMGKDRKTTNGLVFFRQLFGVCAGVAPSIFMLQLVNAFGGGSDAWSKSMLVFGFMSIIAMQICAFSARHHDVERPKEEAKFKVNFKEQFKPFVENKALICLGLMFAAAGLISSFGSSTMMYMAKYVVGDEGLVQKMGMASLPVNLALMPLMPLLLSKFNKKNVYLAGFALMSVKPICLMLFQPYDNITVLLVLQAIFLMGSVMGTFTTYTMIPDVINYGYWKKGVRATGVISAGVTFVSKMFKAFGPLIVGLMMSFVGFAGQEVATSAQIGMIKVIMTIIPIIIAVAGIVALKFYPINKQVYGQMTAELKER